MKKQDQLFYLIKSLTTKEKKNIKKNFDRNSNYLRLFNAIESQSKYDNNEIRELFKNTKFIKQLHVTKNYLIKQILKNITVNNSELSINIKLNNLLSEIEILYKRELLDQCKFLISKAINFATEYEKSSYLNILYEWKRKLIIHKQNIFDNNESITKIINLQKSSIKKELNENMYWELTINQFEYFNKSEEEKNIFYKNTLLQSVNEAKTLRSQINYYHILYTKYVTSNNPLKALEHLNTLLEIIEANEHRIIDEPSAYLTTLNNKVSLLLNMKQYSEIPAILELIRSIPTKYSIHDKEKISHRLSLRTYNIELEMYRDIKNYKKAEGLINEIELFIEANSKVITKDYTVLFYYQFAYIYFMSGKYDKALGWTNRLFQSDFEKIREDIYTYSRFLNLMIHYELNNSIVLKYAVDATRKYLRKKKLFENFEKVLLKFFSKISMSRTEEKENLFIELKKNIFSMTDDKTRNNILDYIDFEEWIENKLNK